MPRQPLTLMRILLLGLGLVLVLASFQQLSPAVQATPPAPVFTVTSTSDLHAGGDLTNGICQTAPNNNVCTLRAAIEKANYWPGGGATITFGVTPPATYTLQFGALVITNSLTLTGGGVSRTIVDGNGAVTNDRVFQVTGGAVVSLGALTIQGGSRTDVGAAIDVTAGSQVRLDNSVVQNNGCACTSSPGAVIANTGVLTLTNSVVAGNNLGSNAIGGAVINGGTAWLVNDTIRDNAADTGGGVLNEGTMTIRNSAIISNTAAGDGGGIVGRSGSLTIINSTISGNRADGAGGGIYTMGPALICRAGSVSLYNTTIANNVADADVNSGEQSGGVANPGNCVTLSFQNSIIAHNYGSFLYQGFLLNGPNYDCGGTLTSLGYNILSSKPADCTINGAYTLADANLGPLQNNGGPTPTHALLAGSVAIDMGETPLCTDNMGLPILTDQRGLPRPANGAGTYRCDIGAFEVQRMLWLPLVRR